MTWPSGPSGRCGAQRAWNSSNSLDRWSLPVDQFERTCSWIDGVLIVTPVGDVDMNTAAELAQASDRSARGWAGGHDHSPRLRHVPRLDRHYGPGQDLEAGCAKGTPLSLAAPSPSVRKVSTSRTLLLRCRPMRRYGTPWTKGATPSGGEANHPLPCLPPVCGQIAAWKALAPALARERRRGEARRGSWALRRVSGLLIS